MTTGTLCSFLGDLGKRKRDALASLGMIDTPQRSPPTEALFGPEAKGPILGPRVPNRTPKSP